MPRYELSAKGPPKFWEIHIVGAEYTLREGTVGAVGKETTITEESHDAALEAAALLIEGRRRRGYRLVGGTEPTRDPVPEGQPLAPAPVIVESPPFLPQNPALDELIQADPDNPAGYLVYGDWLQTLGHPWGELIAVQHALERDPGRAAPGALRAIEAGYFDRYRRRLLGDLALRSQVKITFRLGFIAGARVDDSREFGALAIEDLVRTLQDLPAARFLSDLSVGPFTIPPGGDYGVPIARHTSPTRDYGPLIKLLTSRRVPRALRRLSLGTSALHDNSSVGTGGWPSLGQVEALSGAFPKLEELTLQTSGIHLDGIHLPDLRRFELRSAELPQAAIRAIVAAQWPKLSTLVLWLGTTPSAGDEQALLAPLLSWLEEGGLPSLRHLGLRCTRTTLALCNALARSRILKQLEGLDLWMGSLTDDGAGALRLQHAGAFSHLRVFNLENNRLTREGCLSLSAGMPSLRLGGQRP